MQAVARFVDGSSPVREGESGIYTILKSRMKTRLLILFSRSLLALQPWPTGGSSAVALRRRASGARKDEPPHYAVTNNGCVDAAYDSTSRRRAGHTWPRVWARLVFFDLSVMSPGDVVSGRNNVVESMRRCCCRSRKRYRWRTRRGGVAELKGDDVIELEYCRK